MQEDSLISLKIPGSDQDNKYYVYSRGVSRGESVSHNGYYVNSFAIPGA